MVQLFLEVSQLDSFSNSDHKPAVEDPIFKKICLRMKFNKCNKLACNLYDKKTMLFT